VVDKAQEKGLIDRADEAIEKARSKASEVIRQGKNKLTGGWLL